MVEIKFKPFLLLNLFFSEITAKSDSKYLCENKKQKSILQKLDKIENSFERQEKLIEKDCEKRMYDALFLPYLLTYFSGSINIFFLFRKLFQFEEEKKENFEENFPLFFLQEEEEEEEEEEERKFLKNLKQLKISRKLKSLFLDELKIKSLKKKINEEIIAEKNFVVLN